MLAAGAQRNWRNVGFRNSPLEATYLAKNPPGLTSGLPSGLKAIPAILRCDREFTLVGHVSDLKEPTHSHSHAG